MHLIGPNVIDIDQEDGGYNAIVVAAQRRMMSCSFPTHSLIVSNQLVEVKQSTSIMRVGLNDLVLIIYNLGFLLNINFRPEINVAQSDQAEPDGTNSDVLVIQ